MKTSLYLFVLLSIRSFEVESQLSERLKEDSFNPGVLDKCVANTLKLFQSNYGILRGGLFINEKPPANRSFPNVAPSCNCHLKRFPFTTNYGDFTLKKDDQSDFYVITGWTMEFFIASLREIHAGLYHDGYTTTIMIIHASINLKQLFDSLWDFYFISVLVIDVAWDVWTYYPFTQGQCKWIEPYLIQNCAQLMVEMPKAFTARYFKKFLDERRVDRFRDCQFRIMAMESDPFVFSGRFEDNPGFEIKIVKALLKRTQVTSKFIYSNYSDYGSRLENGTYTGLFKHLQEKHVDIVLGTVTMRSPLTEDFSYLQPHCMATHRFFVPMARPTTVWKNIFYVFTFHTWLSILLSYIGIVLIAWVIDTTSLNDQLFLYFGMALTSINWQPRRSKQRIWFMAWCLSSFILSAAFQSQLIALMCKSGYDKQITNYRELIESGLPFGGFDRSHFEKVEPTIYGKWRNCSLQGAECVELLDQGKFAVFKNTRSILYHIDNVQRTSRLKRISSVYGFKDAFTMYFVMYLQKGSPYKKRFNAIISTLFANGLIDKWDIYDRFKFKPLLQVSSDVKKLNVKHLLAALFILFVGLTCAFVVFLFELFISAHLYVPEL